jgi:hypothetical protein
MADVSAAEGGAAAGAGALPAAPPLCLVDGGIFVFKGFVAAPTEAEHSFYVPCRLLPGAGCLRTWSFRPAPQHGRQTIPCIVPAASLRPPAPPASINGVLMHQRLPAGATVTAQPDGSLAIDDHSEGCHKNLFLPVPLELLQRVSWHQLPLGVATVYVFTARPDLVQAADLEHPVLQSDLDVKVLAFAAFGAAFAAEFLATTHHWPPYWLNDRQLARRPWVHTPRYAFIDGLLAQHAHAPLTQRLLDVEYAALAVAEAAAAGGAHAGAGAAAASAAPATGPPRSAGSAGSSSSSTPADSWVDTQLPLASCRDFILGFGSLINTASRRASAPEAVDAVPVRVRWAPGEAGYVRTWNFQSGSAQLTALGLQPCALGCTLNGILTVVGGESLGAVDAREAGYTRVRVTGRVEALGWQRLPEEGSRFWLYANDAAAPPCPRYPIVQSYIDVCLVGCLEHGRAFAAEFVRSTEGWEGAPWLNDRVLPRRPWVHTPRYKEVDGLLEELAPAALGGRRLAEEYGARYALQLLGREGGGRSAGGGPDHTPLSKWS